MSGQLIVRIIVAAALAATSAAAAVQTGHVGTTQEIATDARVKYLEQHAVRVRTVEPADEDFRDLQPLKRVIGRAPIVMLGEASHFDGTTLLAKSRLVKFLHQEMNFDVLVFESGFYDLAKAWEAIAQGQGVADAITPALAPVWSRSPQLASLFEYIGVSAQSRRPLTLAGFDLQPYGITPKSLLSELGKVAAEFGISEAVTTPGSAAHTLAIDVFARKFVPPSGLPAPDETARRAFYAGLDSLRGKLASIATARKSPHAAFWAQVVSSSLRSYTEKVWWDREHGFADRDWHSYNMRDRQNASNLLWLADHAYRGRKMIVWGATVHLMRHASTIDPNIDPQSPQRPYTTMVPMGDEVERRAGSRAFTIGFTAYEGVTGIGEPGAPNDNDNYHSDIRRDQDTSIEMEELLHAAGFEFAVVDLRNPGRAGGWLKSPIVSRAVAHQGMRASWPGVLDALFYIREMAPNLAKRPR